MTTPATNPKISTDHLRLKLGPLPLYPLKNLVFQGGSVKGTAYGGAVGALEAAFERVGLNFSTQIKNIAGTSAGAITALALSLGTPVPDLVGLIGHTDFKSFLDTKAYEVVSNITQEKSSIMQTKTSTAMATLPLLTNSFGLASGQSILDYLESFAKERTGIDYLTFGELHELVLEDERAELTKETRKDLFVVAYNLTLDAPQVFSYLDTPDSVISDAVRCSMSIPYVFIPHKNYIKKRENSTGKAIRVEASDELWIDGGITDNYPIWVFDRLLGSSYSETMGFYLVSKEEKDEIEGKVVIKTEGEGEALRSRREIKNILDYTKAIIETVISSQQTSAHKMGRDRGRTLYLDHLGTSMMNFGMTLEEKNALVRSGWDSAAERLGLKDEIGKCRLVIRSKSQEDLAKEVGIRDKVKFEKDRGKVEFSGKNDSEPPSPDLDAATDTGSGQKCVIM